MSKMNIVMTKQADVGESFLVFCPRCQKLVATRYNRHLARKESSGGKTRYLVEHRTDCSKCNVTLFAQFLWQGVPPEEGQDREGI